MSDRVKGFVVTLAKDIKDEDATRIADAIRCLHGVLTVRDSIASPDDHMNRDRIRDELSKKLWDVLR